MLASQLKRNDYLRGDDVKAVQKALKAAGFNPGDIDGVYGPMTAAAVVAYQMAMKLVVDGIVGPKTWAAFGL
jgi:peptidoglycan hydrolase-like protein with peptidoglycan-binding domain